ncbi:MAG: dihydrolipoamide acetyltransferase family protein [Aquificaceae bacterium]|jgi:pyruvate dehydrogenase E2 component (dihydrolipoamide acetyltransferase)|uniref:dihydrolipoamide acetyltransferase family protein n=1 Tax=Hydrogenobacter sp. Uz 6-8 TaxID=3384828 RepID=UPI000F2AAC38|nr:MAG: 2-oxo acid dehydrogenase subunit E2 [Aquificota bacterium]
MDYEILMPQFSDTMEKGKIVRWLKKEGDYVEKGEVIAEIEAEKAVMELQSFKKGFIKRILAGEGEEVHVGKSIAIMELGEKVEVLKRPTPVEEKPRVEERRTIPEKKEEKAPPPPPPKKEERVELPPGFASPYARLLAKEKGVELHELQREGRLPSPAHARDVEEFERERYFTPKALELLKEYDLSTDELLREFPERKIDEDLLLAYVERKGIPRKVSISSVQKSLISNLSKSFLFPHYHIYEVFDLSAIPWDKEITLTHWLIKIVGDAMQFFDRLRAVFREDHYLVYPGSHVGVAMAVGDELYNPVVKEVNRKSLRDIAQEVRELRKKAEEGRLSLEEMKGATLTISNLGMFGVRAFDAVIPFGQVCIMAVGMQESDGKAHITFTFDHRVVNGFHAALFVKHLKEKVLDRNYVKMLKKGVQSV